jgi:hypothetical protein
VSLPQQLAALGQGLADPHTPMAERLGRHLRQARALLEAISLEDLLPTVLGRHGAAWARGAMTGHLHLGFLLPAEARLDRLAEQALECGLSDGHDRYPSEIMARDLAWRLGRDDVPTAIFKACVRRPAGSLGIEAFSARVDPGIAAEWVRSGLGTHVAVGLKQLGDVARALRLARSQGFQPPPFLGGQPACNLSHEIRMVYVEGEMEGATVRWEFYHCAAEAEDSR